MIPILFDSTATAFTSNGIGRLSDAKTCVVTEERNGPYTLTMDYPLNGARFSDIRHSNIIVAQPFQGGRLQPFRICHITRPIKGIVKVDAEHISYQLNHIPVMPFSAQGIKNALNGFKANAAEACPFTFWTDLTSTSSFSLPIPAAIRSYLGGRQGSIIDVYGNGAEYEWDGYTVKLHSSRGKNKGVTLRYGKNIIDLKQEENIENTYTGVCPYWVSTEGQLVTLPEKVVHSANAQNFPYQRTIPYDFSDVFDNAPTAAQLREYAQRFIVKNNIGVPNVSIDVKFINLADTAEYKDVFKSLQSVNLCDTVTVVFAELGVSTEAKVCKTEWDVLNDRYNSVTIGDKRSTLSTTIEDQMERVDEAPTTAQMHASIDRATGVLGAGLRGHVVINRNAEGFANEILFLDTDNLYTAKNVLRINMNGIGFSSTGYRGPYYQSWTIDAHFALGGVNNANGVFEILDSSGKAYGRWDKDGLKLFDNSQRMLLAINHGGLYLYNPSNPSQVLAQLTAQGLNIYGGYIKLGNKFEVRQDGTMTATGANFSGKITASTIDIGKNFHVNEKGELTATNAKFSGDIEGSKITGSRIESKGGQFIASEEDVYIGGFHTFSTDAGQYLATDGEDMGIGDNEDYHFWTGWKGGEPDINDPEDILSEYGTVITKDDMYAQELYLHNRIFSGSHWWGVGETIDDIYDRLDSLQNQIDHLDPGGDE